MMRNVSHAFNRAGARTRAANRSIRGAAECINLEQCRDSVSLAALFYGLGVRIRLDFQPCAGCPALDGPGCSFPAPNPTAQP